MTTRAAPVRHRASRRVSLTLVEMVASIVLVGMLLAAALAAVGATKVSQQKLHERRRGHELAQELMTEILQQYYADPVAGPDSFGLSAAEAATGDRSLFDDVDDYNGWKASPPQRKDGAVRNELAGWTRSVGVAWVDPADVSRAVNNNQGAKRIDITVFHHDVPVAELAAVRTSDPPATEACCLGCDWCMDLPADTCVEWGGEPLGPGTSCYVADCLYEGRVVFEGYTDTVLRPGGQTINIATPPNAAEGDLLIVAIAGDSDISSFTTPLGWQQAALTSMNNQVILGVWWKIASASEPPVHTFKGNKSKEMYGWMMRFTGQAPTDPITAVEVGTGFSFWPEAKSAYIAEANALVLRLGAFDGGNIIAGDPGLSGHVPITMKYTSTGAAGVSGGAGYIVQSAAGDCGTAYFRLTGLQEWVTATLVIAPADPCADWTAGRGSLVIK